MLSADDAELVDVQTDLSGNLRVAVADSIDEGVVVAEVLQPPPGSDTPTGPIVVQAPLD